MSDLTQELLALDTFAESYRRYVRGGDQPIAPDPPSVPVNTSEMAAEAIKPHRATIYRTIVAYVVSRGAEGATADEVERDTHFKGSTVRPRLVEATVDGGPLVVCQDTRKTRSGRQARVYRAVGFAP